MIGCNTPRLMLTRHRTGIFLLVISFLVVSAPVVASCSKTLRWSDDSPYSYTYDSESQPGEVIGINVDIVREALRRLGCDMNLVKLPWARALEELKLGRIDVLSNAYRKPEREEYAWFSTQGIQSPNVLFVRANDRDRWYLKKLADIQPIQFLLGVQVNVSYSPEYDQLLQEDWFKSRLRIVSDRSSLWRMLALRRVDGVIADTITGKVELKELGLNKEIMESDLIISNDPAFYAFSKKTTDKAFVDLFDQAIKAMHKDGTYDTILNRYLN